MIKEVQELRETFRSRKKSIIPDDIPTYGEDGLVILAGDELAQVKADFLEGFVHGPPFFVMDYTSITLEFFKIFEKIEERLKELGNLVYMRVYEKKNKWESPGKAVPPPPRIALVKAVMSAENAKSKANVQCLEVMAEEIRNSRRDLKDFWYF